MALVDLVKFTANSSGTGAITAGSPVSGYRGVEVLTDGGVYSYSIQQEGQWEFGQGTYLAASRTFVRSPRDTSNGGLPVDLQPNAGVAIVALVEDLLALVLPADQIDAAVIEATAEAKYWADDARQTRANFPNYFKGDKGDAGGNVESLGNFVPGMTPVIGIGTTRVVTSGATGGEFVWDSTLTETDRTAYPLAMFTDTLGRTFRRSLSFLTLAQFGAVADYGGANTDSLPAFNAAKAYIARMGVNADGGVNLSGAQLNVLPGSYYSSGTWIFKGVTFRLQGCGQGKDGPKISRIMFAPNTDGIQVQRYNTSGSSGGSVTPITYGADSMYIDGMCFESMGGTYNSTSEKHGANFRARVTFTNNQVIGFPGCGGIAIVSAGSADREGNANCMTIRDNLFSGNADCGLLVSGPDVNAGGIGGNDFSRNGRFGYASNALLGNEVRGNHADANGVKGFGYNTVGSSVVRFGPNNDRYFVMPGQAVAASTTQPGTNPAVWGPYPAGPGVLPGHPLWYSGIPVFEGGPYAIVNANDVMILAGNYAEGGQAPVVIGPKTVCSGNQFGEVGVITVDSSPVFNLTNFQGAANSPGGFRSMRGLMTTSINFAGYLQEFITPSFPQGAQYRPTTAGIAFGYAGGNDLFRINGPNAPARAATFEVVNRLALVGLPAYADNDAAAAAGLEVGMVYSSFGILKIRV